MASLHPLNSRRRSRSASNSSPISRRSPDNSLRIAAKRMPPLHTFSQGSTLQKGDVDAWRRGKRRRRDISPPDVTMDFVRDLGQHDARCSPTQPRPTFPASSADFDIFPRLDRSLRRRASYSSPVRSDTELSNTPTHIELTRLRSNAFWELHRSVAENGEGFVQRMRDYERIRSRQISDSTRRIYKRSLIFQATRSASSMHDSDVSDDDIQILAGETANRLPSCTANHNKKGVSLNIPSQNLPHPPSRSRFTPPSSPCYALPPLYHSDGGQLFASADTSSPGSSSVSYPSTTPSSLSSPVDLQSPDLDACSVLSLPSSAVPFFPFAEESGSTSSEKVVTELSLALANGAGSLNDYSCLQNITSLHRMDEGEPGELWH